MARSKKNSAGPGDDPAPATRQAEIETKLEIDPTLALPSLAERRRLTAVGVVAVAEPRTHHLDATYYDTAGLDLLGAKLTLRRRTGGDDAGWHLKLPAADGARTEVRLPLTAGDEGEVPAELAGLVRGAARGRDLVPVARLVNDRTVRHLLDDSGTTLIEVADDRVTATPLLVPASPDDASADPSSGDPPQPTPSQWRELEAEIVDGTREQLAATVQVLIAAGASRASSASKLARAIGLPPITPRRSKSAGAAMISAVGRQRDLLISTDRSLRDATVPTDSVVDDARAILRRLSAALTVYRQLFDGDAAAALSSELEAAGEVVTQVVDLLGIRERLMAQLVDEPAEYTPGAQQRLREAFTARLEAANGELENLLDGDRYLQLLRDLDDLVSRPPLSRRGHRQATVELPEMINERWEALRQQADEALTDPDHAPAVHEVRASATTLRYAAEAAIAALGPDAAVVASALEEIQEALEEYQNARSAAALLTDLASDSATDGLTGFTFGRLHAFEQAMAHGALEEFSDVWDRVEDGELIADLRR